MSSTIENGQGEARPTHVVISMNDVGVIDEENPMTSPTKPVPPIASATQLSSPVLFVNNQGPAQGPSSCLATASLVLGILSLFMVGPNAILAPLAIIFGSVAMCNISSKPGMRGGCQAVSGLILGLLSVLGWTVILFLCFLPALSA